MNCEEDHIHILFDTSPVHFQVHS
ncbi:hypothetical protein [Virgibacillus ndiopensis]